MRILASLLVVAAAGSAHADTGVSFDFGYLHNKVAVTDQTAIGGDVGRFAISISTGRYFHFGAEAEEARLAGSTPLPDGAVARTTGETTPTPTQGPLDGNMLGLKMFAGGHVRSGLFMFGADVAGGVRDTWVSSDAGNDVAGRKGEPLLEVRSRADFFITPTATLGVVASTDLIERRDVGLGAVFALHFMR
jgi:hypothetical protein